MRNQSHASVDTDATDTREFLIRHEKLDLNLFLSPCKSLLLHEETIRGRIDELKSSLLHDGAVKDPVIIDADSRVVLDGMHRVAALRELHCLYIPVCAVDYLNPNIKVGAWFRVFSGPVSPADFQAAVSPRAVRMERLSIDPTSLAENTSLAILFANGDSFRLTSPDLETYQVLKMAERSARELRLHVAFETEHDAIQALVNKRTDAILTIPRIDKESVRQAGRTGQLLPHKVTRHIIPARPLGVNVPLKMLTDKTLRLQEANRQFVTDLFARGTTRRPAGAVIGGRRYEEETFIFN